MNLIDVFLLSQKRETIPGNTILGLDHDWIFNISITPESKKETVQKSYC